MQLEKGKYYRCISCGRTYRCRIVGIAHSSCGHSLEQQKEITKSEYLQIRKNTYRDQDAMQETNKKVREAAERYSIPVSASDDAVSIFGKAIGLKKRQVISLFGEIGWQLYHRRQDKIKAKAHGGSMSREMAENIPPEMSDLMFFNNLEILVARARGIPHTLQMEMHPKYREYSYLFSVAIEQFAYCYPAVNYCSQEALRWLFGGIYELVAREGEKESALLEAEEILKKRRGG